MPATSVFRRASSSQKGEFQTSNNGRKKFISFEMVRTRVFRRATEQDQDDLGKRMSEPNQRRVPKERVERLIYISKKQEN